MFKNETVAKVAVVSILAAALPIGFFFTTKGITHLNVKENQLKMLVGSLGGTPLSEQFRDGTVSPNPYTPPLGKVFVVTDLSMESNIGPSTFDIGFIETTNNILLWRCTSDGSNSNEHISGSIVIESGYNIGMIAFSGNASKCRILGYETEDI